MKKLLYTLLLSIPLGLMGQAFTQRTNGTFTPTDPFLNVPKGLYIPRVCDTIGAVQGLDTLGAIIFDKCNHKLYIRDTAVGAHKWTEMGSGSYTFTNGLRRLPGNIVKAGTGDHTFLDSTIIIQYNARRTIGSINKNLLLTNVGIDSLPAGASFWEYPVVVNESSQQPKGINVNMIYKEAWNDTNNLQYGGPINTYWLMQWNPSSPRYAQPGGTIISIPYTGINTVNRLFFPRDSINIFSGANGWQGSMINGDFAMGDTCGYKIYIQNSAQPYPLAVFGSRIDLQRNIARQRKRNITGLGITGFFADYKDYQGNINGSTFQDSSYHSKIFDYYSAGEREGDYTVTGATKAYILGISTNDSVFGYYSAPKWSITNNVNNGYGFVQRGSYDFNWFQGKTTFGGSESPSWLNTPNNNFYRVHIDSTLLIGNNKIGTGSFPDTTSYIAMGWQQYGLTSSVFSTNATKKKGIWLTFDNAWASTNTSTTYPNSSTAGLFCWNWVRANDTVYVASNGTGSGGLTGAEFGLLFRKNTGFTDTTLFIGGSIPATAPSALSTRLDVGQSSLPAGGENLFSGYFSAFTPSFQFFGSRNKMDNAIWLDVGVNQVGSAGTVTNGYGAYFNAFASNVVNKYAIYQAGTADSNYFAGPIRATGLSGTGTRIITTDATGNITAGQATSTIPTVSTGTAAPLTTPTKVGDMYVDTNNKKIYVATGTASSADWTILN